MVASQTVNDPTPSAEFDPALDPTDPFPLRPIDSIPYAASQAHSARVDEWLGLRTEQTELELARAADGQQLWVGLPTKALLTPYTELRSLLDRLAPAPGSAIVDLGAGYGRMGFVIARHHPGVSFLGYELASPRAREANRAFARSGIEALARVEVADLGAAGFRPAVAGTYFIYDFGSRDAIRKALADLREIAASHPILVVGRGRATRDEIERGQPWLSQVVPPEHHAHYSLYRSG